MDDPKVEDAAAEAPVAAVQPEAAEVPTVISTNTGKPGRYRVVDAQTGEEIERVIEADSVAGMVRRFAVESGNLVREDDHFVVIEESRAIRIEIANA